MLDVYGTSCHPPRSRWTRTVARPAVRSSHDRRGRVPAYLLPGLTAIVLVALMLHLLVELAFRLSLADPAGAVSVAVGMAAVLVILLPFAVLCAERAHGAWNRTDGGRGAKPRPPAGLAPGAG